MRSQPPEDNNPANPLIKVAALELTKEYVGSGKSRRIKVQATLNFNKSESVGGRAKDYNGQNINVIFELSVRRATLSLECTDDRGRAPSGFVQIEKVAFVSSSVVSNKIKETLSTNESERKSKSALFGGRMKAKSTALGVEARLGGGFATENKSHSTLGAKISRNSADINVSATHAGCSVNWEIGSQGPYSICPEGEYLRGEVFKSPKNGRPINACSIKRNDGGPISSVVLGGSLMTTMDNLIIGRITLTNDNGEVINWTDIRSSETKLSSFLGVLDPNAAKQRVIKQIIRKHLVNQGMKTEGSLVEISRASA